VGEARQPDEVDLAGFEVRPAEPCDVDQLEPAAGCVVAPPGGIRRIDEDLGNDRHRSGRLAGHPVHQETIRQACDGGVVLQPRDRLVGGGACGRAVIGDPLRPDHVAGCQPKDPLADVERASLSERPHSGIDVIADPEHLVVGVRAYQRVPRRGRKVRDELPRSVAGDDDRYRREGRPR
jgi:hypothetical protein